MKIAFLSALYPPRTRGGGELSTHYIAQGLQARGHQVIVMTSAAAPPTYEIDGIEVVSLNQDAATKPLLERRHAKKIATELAQVLATHGPFDVIHGHDFRMALALSELKLRRSVVTARDYAQICGSTNFLSIAGGPCPGCTWDKVWRNHRVAEASLLRQPWRAWQYAHNLPYRTAAFRMFRQQIFISRAQQEIIARQQDLSGVTTQVIYNPVPSSFLASPPTAGQPQRLLYVGTVEWYKGVELLLTAFKNIVTQFPEATLSVVGEGADKKRYETLVSHWKLSNRITFTGRVPYNQLQPVYDGASVVVAPHIWVEPFGRSVVEAMARGKVVIAARHGGPAEIIQENKTGLLFTPHSIEALTASLRQAISLPEAVQSEMGQSARAWAAEHLTSDTIATQHEAAYQQIVARQ